MAPKENRGAETPSLFFEDCALLGKGQELAAQLFYQESIFRRLLELSHKKRMVLLKCPLGLDQAAELESIVREEAALVEEAGKCASFWESFGEMFQRKDMEEDLKEKWKCLSSIMAELKALNCENREILGRFKSYIDFSLKLLVSGVDSGTYQRESTKDAVKKVFSSPSRIIGRV